MSDDVDVVVGPETGISLISILRDAGFQPDDGEPPNVIAFDFGTFRLCARQCLRWDASCHVVVLSAIVPSPNQLTEVFDEVPAYVSSPEEGLAWVAWRLDRNHQSHGKLPLTPAWLVIGRKNLNLLPYFKLPVQWEQEQREWRSRPLCYVERERLRPVLKRLARESAEGREKVVTLSFDGTVLLFVSGQLKLPVAATGTAWAESFDADAVAFRELPRRLEKEAAVLVGPQGIYIGGREYRLVSRIVD
jgi:hypothetical protein